MHEPLRASYSAFMDEYRAPGHVTEALTNSLVSPAYYLPHRVAIKAARQSLQSFLTHRVRASQASP